MAWSEGFEECLFCDKDFTGYRIIDKYGTCYVVEDTYPVSLGHVLIIPFRHVETVFDLTNQELSDMMVLVKRQKTILDKKYLPTGYNIGWNCGEDAGQTIMHCHLHLIPRYKNDIQDPRGGIRGCIPNKRIY